MNQQVMHIGLDDTDSTRKGCTTYVAALLVEKLEKLNVTFLDYPNLIRLNPNVPWKTRGNGALCLRIKYAVGLEDQIKEATISLVEEHSDLGFRGTDPGVVFFKKAEIPEELKVFAQNAVTSIVTMHEAMRLIKKFESEALGFNTCRGIIGALAAVGETLEGDYTYELIAYRLAENCGLKREVSQCHLWYFTRTTASWYPKQRGFIGDRGFSNPAQRRLRPGPGGFPGDARHPANPPGDRLWIHPARRSAWQLPGPGCL